MCGWESASGLLRFDPLSRQMLGENLSFFFWNANNFVLQKRKFASLDSECWKLCSWNTSLQGLLLRASCAFYQYSSGKWRWSKYGNLSFLNKSWFWYICYFFPKWKFSPKFSQINGIEAKSQYLYLLWNQHNAVTWSIIEIIFRSFGVGVFPSGWMRDCVWQAKSLKEYIFH